MRRAFMGGAAAAALVVTSYAVWSFARPGRLLRHDGFVTIEILVVNHARRAAYAWRDSVAYLQDDCGNRYAPVSSQAFAVSPGTSRTVCVAFDVPVDARGLAVRFRDGIRMSDAVDRPLTARLPAPLA